MGTVCYSRTLDYQAIKMDVFCLKSSNSEIKVKKADFRVSDMEAEQQTSRQPKKQQVRGKVEHASLSHEI
jgi:hypothetical protein